MRKPCCHTIEAVADEILRCILKSSEGGDTEQCYAREIIKFPSPFCLALLGHVHDGRRVNLESRLAMHDESFVSLKFVIRRKDAT
jgi:hypothetical protein